MVTIDYKTAKNLSGCVLMHAAGKDHISTPEINVLMDLRCRLNEAVDAFENAPDWLNAGFAFPMTREEIDCMCWVDFPEVGA